MIADELFNAGDRFEVRRWLGTGGMGVVYEAYDRELQETVALKTLRHVDERWMARFKKEFRSLHDLAHPNLVALGELFDGEHEPFFTMELIRGVSFLDYVRENEDGAAPGPPTAPTGIPGMSRPRRDPAIVSEAKPFVPVAYNEQRLRAALKQVAMGVGALHAAGKVHRDIKPSNILVTEEGRVVLLDFGLVTESEGGSHSTDAAIVGTVAYMAPEQALSKITPAADWYSVGVLLFEALTGAVPHTGEGPYEILIQKHQVMASPPRQLVPETPPDLDALCIALLEQEPQDRPRVRDIFDRLGIDRREGLSPDSTLSRGSVDGALPFVGRTEQLATLRAAYEQVADGPYLVLIDGVSGVGKSALVEQFLSGLRGDDSDAIVLSSRCYEREVLSYKAFDGIADGLARFLSRRSRREIDPVMPPRRALLGRLFPVLKRVESIAGADLVPDVPDPHDQRLRMFAALRQLFVNLAESGSRLVWYFDDLQWTDADSLVLMQELIAHEQRFPVLILATMRPVDSPERKRLVRDIGRLAPMQRIHLGELDSDESRRLAQLLLPGGESGMLDSVATSAGGHPLFLHELARHAGAASAGATFAEMLTARIERLVPAARRLLRVLAAYGGPMTQEVAAVAAGLSTAEEIKTARILRAAHLARTDGVRRTDRIVVTHDRVREHVMSSLDDARRTQLHDRLALALEQTGAADGDPRAVVRHARAAGRHALAARYAQLAARRAVAALAFDQASEFFATAIELGDHSAEELRDLQIEQATALMHAGRGPEAAALFMEAAEGADPDVRLDCQRQAADQWLITGHLDKGMEALASSLADIGEPIAASPRRALARVIWNRVRLRLRGIRHKPRRESQIAPAALQRLDVLRAVAHGLAMVDNIRGADFNGRLLLAALRVGEPRRLIGALATEVVFLASQGGGAGRRARRLFAELVRIADQFGNDAYARSWVLLSDGATSFFEGRFTPALESLEQIESIFAEGPAGLTLERNNARVFRVHTLRMLGRIRQQTSLISGLLRSGRQRGDRYLETTLQLLHCYSLLATGQLDDARAGVENATWVPPDRGFHLQHWYELRARVELAIYHRAATEAVQALAERFAALQGSMLLRVKLVRADAFALRGQLLLAAASEGNPPPNAEREVLRIIAKLDREKVGYADVFAGLLRAGLVACGRPREDAIAELREVVRVAAENDMATHGAAAQAQLAGLVDGDEAEALNAEWQTYVANEGIVAPHRLFHLIAPGFATSR